MAGAPNDGFLLNTLKTLFRLSRVLKMHSKRHYKLCICSVILEKLESFWNYKGVKVIFPKILGEIWRITKVRRFLILNAKFLNSKILGSLFPTKNSLTREVKCESSSKIVHEWNCNLQIFSRPQVIENSRQYLLLRTSSLQKTVVRCLWYGSLIYV